MKIQPKEALFLYRTVMILTVLLGLALFVILCFIAKIWLPACITAMEQVSSNIGIIW